MGLKGARFGLLLKFDVNWLSRSGRSFDGWTCWTEIGIEKGLGLFAVVTNFHHNSFSFYWKLFVRYEDMED